YPGPSGPPPGAYQWGPTETTENLAQFKNQYIRVNIDGMGWVVAQLLGTEPGGVVTLNVFQKGDPTPQFMRINRKNLTGLTPLGFTPPPEIFGGGGGMGGGGGGMGGNCIWYMGKQYCL
ncbi:hypothetical protein BOY45_004110, partial [Shigella flexneri]|nr:hypothetical protein [Shigella flexneri]